ncbi:MAG: hypothetical protein Q4A00_06640 [Flavobacteriaceae bacterium]|nr:hypothetical protein [Flavobacteriaceae bacterium]
MLDYYEYPMRDKRLSDEAKILLEQLKEQLLGLSYKDIRNILRGLDLHFSSKMWEEIAKQEETEE